MGMICNKCSGIEKVFNQEMASRELTNYRKKGPDGGTRRLIDALKSEGVEAMTLLDIGGGVGAIQHELFKAGLAAATDVDASSAYLETAQEESGRQGTRERSTFHHGNFVEIAPEIDPADIVTLDRVICCYADMQGLVRLSSQRAKKFYAVVFPRDHWLLRIGGAVGNFFLRLSGNPFRFFVHPTAEVEAIVESNGLRRRHYFTSGFMWQVIVYARA
jgi:magnesium-protoporphyrin O-methyltransferase